MGACSQPATLSFLDLRSVKALNRAAGQCFLEREFILDRNNHRTHDSCRCHRRVSSSEDAPSHWRSLRTPACVQDTCWDHHPAKRISLRTLPDRGLGRSLSLRQVAGVPIASAAAELQTGGEALRSPYAKVFDFRSIGYHLAQFSDNELRDVLTDSFIVSTETSRSDTITGRRRQGDREQNGKPPMIVRC